MKYLKLFENFNDVESTKDNLYDLFIDFEDYGWNVKSDRNRIVPDRNDWTGNFQSTKVRNVWGSEFIDYDEDVIMTKDDRKWESVDCFTVNMSKTHYIKPVDDTLPYFDKHTDDSFDKHWKDLDDYIISKLPAIRERAKRLGLELFGIHGKWFTLGKASHSNFSNEPYFGWQMLTDNIVFAFIPIKTNEGLFESSYDNKYIGKSDKSNWSDDDKEFLDDVKIEAFSDYEFKEIEKLLGTIDRKDLTVEVKPYRLFSDSIDKIEINIFISKKGRKKTVLNSAEFELNKQKQITGAKDDASRVGFSQSKILVVQTTLITKLSDEYFWIELKNKLTHNTYNFKCDGFEGLIITLRKILIG